MLERSAGENGALWAALVFAALLAGGEYGGGGSATAGRRVGTVVAKGLLAFMLFLAAVMGDVLDDAFDVDRDVLLPVLSDFLELSLLRKLLILRLE